MCGGVCWLAGLLERKLRLWRQQRCACQTAQQNMYCCSPDAGVTSPSMSTSAVTSKHIVRQLLSMCCHAPACQASRGMQGSEGRHAGARLPWLWSTWHPCASWAVVVSQTGPQHLPPIITWRHVCDRAEGGCADHLALGQAGHAKVPNTAGEPPWVGTARLSGIKQHIAPCSRQYSSAGPCALMAGIQLQGCL